MTDPRLQFVQCLDSRGLHRMAYWEHGDPANPHVVVCVHGLTRQGRDFDMLAAALQPHVRVVCPDIAGRGRSDRLADPADYKTLQYVCDIVTLLARLNARTVDWVGTSMGGLIGLTFAALKGSPLRRFVINDVGPTLRKEGIARIADYVGKPMSYASVEEAAAYLRTICQGFGPHTDEQWLELSRPMVMREGDRFVPHYDLNIALPFRAMTPEAGALAEAAMWKAWDSLSLPTLLLRGADSDLLDRDTALAMTQRGPRARLVEFAGIGHAPMFTSPDQIDAVREFLLSP